MRLISIAALLIWGCDFNPRTDLKALTSQEQSGPNCAACHHYPPPDPNHALHMGHAVTFSKNGSISCRDCHSTSILGRPTLVFDSIFATFDSLGQPIERSGLANPDFQFIRDWNLIRVDTLRQIRPIEQPGSTKTAGFLKQWMTGISHLNGIVDIQFDSLVSDTSRFLGQPAAYHPDRQSCSAVQCHRGGADYRWANPSKGLPAKGRYDEK